LLESFRKGQRWLTLIFVATIGLVFVFFFGSGGSGFGPATPAGNSVVELDEIRLTSRDFSREQRQLENRFRQQLGDAYDQVGGDQFVAGQALSQMINTLVLATAAEDIGLHVTTNEVRRIVQSSPGFIDQEGKFSPLAFKNFAESEYGTQRAFIQNFSRSLLGQKLIQLLAAQTAVSDAEIDLLIRYEREEVRIAYVAIDGTILPEGEQVSDEEVEAWAEENETALRALFNERAPGLATPERARARHLLVQVASDATEDEQAAARAVIEGARTRIEAGEAFADVAGELSQDVATAPNGGDLGLVERGDNDPALDEAIFSLEPAVLSDTIRTDYGLHLVLVESREEAQPADWNTSRLDLARERAEQERAASLATEQANRLVDAVEAGTSLEEAARLEGLTLERPPGLKRRPDGFVPGLGAAEALLTEAFVLEPGASSPMIFEIAGSHVLFQVLDRTAPDDATVAAQREERREQFVSQKQNAAIDRWLTDYRRQLEESGRLLVNAELALGSS